MNRGKRAFTLLEFLIFIFVLGILITAMLGSLAVIGLEDSRGAQNVEIYNVPICNKPTPNCVFQSSILESARVYEVNATIP